MSRHEISDHDHKVTLATTCKGPHVTLTIGLTPEVLAELVELGETEPEAIGICLALDPDAAQAHAEWLLAYAREARTY